MYVLSLLLLLLLVLLLLLSLLLLLLLSLLYIYIYIYIYKCVYPLLGILGRPHRCPLVDRIAVRRLEQTLVLLFLGDGVGARILCCSMFSGLGP